MNCCKLIKHEKYGKIGDSFDYEKLFPFLFSDTGIKNGETPIVKLQIKRSSYGFFIEILDYKQEDFLEKDFNL